MCVRVCVICLLYRHSVRTGVMDDAWLVDTGDWRQPSIVVLESRDPRQLNHVTPHHSNTTALLLISRSALA